MQVIVVASRKGGAGKTTLSAHLACEASRIGRKTALLDTDPQGSLTAWWNERDDEAPALLRLADDLASTVAQARQIGFDLLVVDTPPAIGDIITQGVGAADLVVVPITPSPLDIRAAGATVDLIEAAGKRPIFVVNNASQRARITTDTVIALSQHGPVAKPVIHHRNDFRVAMIRGRVVSEVDPKSRSVSEIGDLWAYLAKNLEAVSYAA